MRADGTIVVPVSSDEEEGNQPKWEDRQPTDSKAEPQQQQRQQQQRQQPRQQQQQQPNDAARDAAVAVAVAVAVAAPSRTRSILHSGNRFGRKPSGPAGRTQQQHTRTRTRTHTIASASAIASANRKRLRQRQAVVDSVPHFCRHVLAGTAIASSIMALDSCLFLSLGGGASGATTTSRGGSLGGTTGTYGSIGASVEKPVVGIGFFSYSVAAGGGGEGWQGGAVCLPYEGGPFGYGSLLGPDGNSDSNDNSNSNNNSNNSNGDKTNTKSSPPGAAWMVAARTSSVLAPVLASLAFAKLALQWFCGCFLPEKGTTTTKRPRDLLSLQLFLGACVLQLLGGLFLGLAPLKEGDGDGDSTTPWSSCLSPTGSCRPASGAWFALGSALAYLLLGLSAKAGRGPAQEGGERGSESFGAGVDADANANANATDNATANANANATATLAAACKIYHRHGSDTDTDTGDEVLPLGSKAFHHEGTDDAGETTSADSSFCAHSLGHQQQQQQQQHQYPPQGGANTLGRLRTRMVRAGDDHHFSPSKKEPPTTFLQRLRALLACGSSEAYHHHHKNQTLRGVASVETHCVHDGSSCRAGLPLWGRTGERHRRKPIPSSEQGEATEEGIELCAEGYGESKGDSDSEGDHNSMIDEEQAPPVPAALDERHWEAVEFVRS